MLLQLAVVACQPRWLGCSLVVRVQDLVGVLARSWRGVSVRRSCAAAHTSQTWVQNPWAQRYGPGQPLLTQQSGWNWSALRAVALVCYWEVHKSVRELLMGGL